MATNALTGEIGSPGVVALYLVVVGSVCAKRTVSLIWHFALATTEIIPPAFVEVLTQKVKTVTSTVVHNGLIGMIGASAMSLVVEEQRSAQEHASKMNSSAINNLTIEVAIVRAWTIPMNSAILTCVLCGQGGVLGHSAVPPAVEV